MKTLWRQSLLRPKLQAVAAESEPHSKIITRQPQPAISLNFRKNELESSNSSNYTLGVTTILGAALSVHVSSSVLSQAAGSWKSHKDRK